MTDTARRRAIDRVPGAVRLLRSMATSTAVRRSWAVKVRRAPNLFQPYIDTAFDRYPALFDLVRTALADRTDVRLLSFGCSTGEEVFTLRRYFPDAAITGVDVNAGNILECRRRLHRSGDPGIRFVWAGSARRQPPASFDAVFCLAVLRHGDLSESDPETCGHRVTFAAFDRTVTELARCLRPGGYLVLEHSNFRFADTSAAGRFEVVHRRPRTPDDRRTPLFGPDDRRLPDPDDVAVVFRRLPGAT